MKETEKLVYYNANPNDKYTGDCVKRSLSIAYNLDYKKVGSELRSIQKSLNSSYWNVSRVYEEFIKRHGFIERKLYSTPDRVNLETFSELNNIGTYIVLCGATKLGRVSHMVTIINGDIYDSWDSSDYYVFEYYKVSEKQEALYDATDDLDFYSDAIKNNFDEIVKSESRFINKLFKKYNINQSEYLDGERCYIYNNSINYNANTLYFVIVYEINNQNSKFNGVRMSKRCSIKISPRKSKDENLVEVLDGVVEGIRSLYKAVASDMKEYFEKQEYNKIYNSEDDYSSNRYKGVDSYSSYRAINKLPEWCRPLINYYHFDEYNKRNGYDCYRVYMDPLENDPDQSEVFFNADSWRDLVYQIDRYKENYSRSW